MNLTAFAGRNGATSYRLDDAGHRSFFHDRPMARRSIIALQIPELRR
jgi:hypothetical protein